MSQQDEINKHFGEMLKKLIPNLIIDLIVPLILYFAIRPFTNDLIALIVAGAVPTFHTIILGIIRRRIDWIGIVAILGFSVALVASALFGGSTLALKVSHPLITGTLGLIFLLSLALKKPLIITILETIKKGNPERFNKPEIHKKFKVITAVLGLVFIIDASIHVILAITLTTSTYLILDKIVTVGMLIIIFLVARYSWQNK